MQADELLWRAADRCEPRAVLFHLRVMENPSQSVAQNAGGKRVVRRYQQPVVHPSPLPARAHNTRSPQISEMAGNLGLVRLENLDEIADTDFLASHKVEQAQPGAVGQGAKEALTRNSPGTCWEPFHRKDSSRYMRISVYVLLCSPSSLHLRAPSVSLGESFAITAAQTVLPTRPPAWARPAPVSGSPPRALFSPCQLEKSSVRELSVKTGSHSRRRWPSREFFR